MAIVCGLAVLCWYVLCGIGSYVLAERPSTITLIDGSRLRLQDFGNVVRLAAFATALYALVALYAPMLTILGITVLPHQVPTLIPFALASWWGGWHVAQAYVGEKRQSVPNWLGDFIFRKVG